ncbi:c-type cytochrome [Xanthobacteraceae bacterium A53D]
MGLGTGMVRAPRILAAVIGLAWLAVAPVAAQPAKPAVREVTVWDVPEVDMLPDDDFGRLVRYGRSVLKETSAHIGPAVADPAFRFAGNNMACADCHLNSGLKKFGLPLVAAAADYPAYSTRSGGEATLVDRLNSCMTRSMNGRPMPADARPMQGLVAYLDLLSKHIPEDARISGGGAGKMAELSRPADPTRGAAVFAQNCAACHRRDGLGVRRNPVDASFGYGVPPLWGADSFNDGAGLARLITFANFVHDNMPNGTDWLMPQLSPDDAWDVGAFVLSQPRPHLAGTERDFPDLLNKPVDTAYGPYADNFSQDQHKYGPFGPIREAVERLKAEKGSVPNPNR